MSMISSSTREAFGSVEMLFVKVRGASEGISARAVGPSDRSGERGASYHVSYMDCHMTAGCRCASRDWMDSLLAAHGPDSERAILSPLPRRLESSQTRAPVTEWPFEALAVAYFPHPVARAVSSALRRFTSVFGMRTGGSAAL